MNKQKTIVFKISDNLKDKMIEHYDYCKKPNNPPYSVFQAIEGDTVVTLYESGKVMFQGISADIDANLWIDQEKYFNDRDIYQELKEKDLKENDKTYYYYDAIGSDEVGTGDYFGPLVFTATLVNKESRKLLESLKISDSKKMNDEKIKRCAPIIMKKIPYATYTVSNKEYNLLTSKGFNMNKIKTIFHNKILYELSNKGISYHKIIIDQFTTPRSYFTYLKQENIDEKVTKLIFVTKGESKHLSIAAASVISRYIFLEELDKLSKKYKIDIPKGAGDKVDKVGKEIVEKYGNKTLKEITKYNFNNTKKILDN